MAVIRHRDYKVVANCMDCGRKLPRFNRHHERCHKCWVIQQRMRGNLTMIGGLK
jgi:hypothetical protein